MYKLKAEVVKQIWATGDVDTSVTRGDNCVACEQVSRDRIIGRVTEVHRLSGFRPWYAIPTRRFTVDDRAYRVYSRVWAATWQVRRVYYIVRFRAYGVRRRVMRLLRRKRQ